MSAQISTPISRGKVDSVTELPTTETLPTTTVSFLLPSALRCSLQSELLALVWPLQPASSAQLRLLPLCYICLNEPLSGEWGERGSEWESITEHRMGGRRERGAVSTFWWWRGREREREGESDMGGEGCGSAECFHFDQFFTISIFFSHHNGNWVTSVWKTLTC